MEAGGDGPQGPLPSAVVRCTPHCFESAVVTPVANTSSGRDVSAWHGPAGWRGSTARLSEWDAPSALGDGPRHGRLPTPGVTPGPGGRGRPHSRQFLESQAWAPSRSWVGRCCHSEVSLTLEMDNCTPPESGAARPQSKAFVSESLAAGPLREVLQSPTEAGLGSGLPCGIRKIAHLPCSVLETDVTVNSHCCPLKAVSPLK